MGDKLSSGPVQNGINFEFELNLTSTAKTIGILTVLRCISGQNLVVLTETGEKLSCGQAQNEAKFYFQIKFDLENQGGSPKKIGIFTKVFCISDANLVILA